MSLFNRSITAVTTADLQELLADQAVENIRLEFKSAAPTKDELLKKLSSLANTYGGYLVVGAADDGSGRLRALPGIEPIAGYRQQVVQWCYDGVWPPIEVFVSDSIPSPGDASKVCYVIEVPLSAETPHFLEGRKGAYIRTDEFSQRFEPRLASWEELSHLSQRRAALTERREGLRLRSVERFNTYAASEYGKDQKTKGGMGATLFVTIAPVYPQRQLIALDDLLTRFTTHHIAWRQNGFPAPNRPKVTAHESLVIPGGAFRFSMVELTVWGHLFYGLEVEDVYEDEQGNRQARGIHSHAIVGYLLLFMAHAASVLKLLDYNGPLQIDVQMVRIRGVPLLYFPYNAPTEVGAAPFDDSLSVRLTSSTNALGSDQESIVGELAKTLFLALNWSAPATGPEAAKALIKKGRDYNFWK